MEKIKALFFAQYLGQKVYRRHSVEYDKYITTELLHGDIFATDDTYFIKDGYLLLRDISQLTDDELICISTIYKGNIRGGLGFAGKKELLRAGKEIIERVNCSDVDALNIETIYHAYQYLLRIGILLPFTYLNEENKSITLSPEQIIGLCWAKIKEIKWKVN